MDFTIIWLEDALDDLGQLVRDIAQDNPHAARKMGDTIIEKASRLGRFPRLGKVFRKLGRDEVREILVYPYRVIYEIQDSSKTIFILSLWPGARQEPHIG